MVIPIPRWAAEKELKTFPDHPSTQAPIDVENLRKLGYID
jgi:hypothetical protein